MPSKNANSLNAGVIRSQGRPALLTSRAANDLNSGSLRIKLNLEYCVRGKGITPGRMDETVSDPTGLHLSFTDECWRHIVSRHPEMQPFKELVVEAIRQPDGIHSGKRDPSRRIYRKRHLQILGLGGPLDLLVFAGGKDGYVATAYFAAYSWRMLGALIWPLS